MNKEENKTPIFNTLSAINVNEHSEKKGKQTYLSWSWAWAEFKKAMPDATYKVWHNPENHSPYACDDNLGYMGFTEVRAAGETHEMWLFVMDGANKAMKSEPYTYAVKEYKKGSWTGGFIDKQVVAASMFDINTTIMRCLVKNLAMFGLGLYIYAGEDVPEKSDEQIDADKAKEFYKRCASLDEKHPGVVDKVLVDFKQKTLGETPAKDRKIFYEQVVGLAKEEKKKADAAELDESNKTPLAGMEP